MNGVKVYRTDEEGTIIATSDGNKISFNIPESETWQAGEQTQNSSTSNSAHQQESPKESNNSASVMQDTPKEESNASIPAGITYVLNKNTKKFHLPNCSSVGTIKPKNRQDTTMSRDEVNNFSESQ